MLALLILFFVCLGGMFCIWSVVNMLNIRYAHWGSIPADESVVLEFLKHRMSEWVVQKRLNPKIAEQMKLLISQDQTYLKAQLFPRVIKTKKTEEMKALLPVTPAQNSPMPTLSDPTVVEVPLPLALPMPTWGEQIPEGLVVLRTCRTLLFWSAFWLVASVWVLVFVNWNEFSPIVRSMTLALVSVGLRMSGVWATRLPGLQQTGLNIQTVGGLFVPVAAYSLTLPELLNLAWRPSWFMVSLLSFFIYSIVAWRTRQLFFTVGACLAVISALLAGMDFLEEYWWPCVVIFVASAYLPLAYWLRRRVPELASVLFWVAQVSVPVNVSLACWFQLSVVSGPGVFATTLWGGIGFYVVAALLALWIENRCVPEYGRIVAVGIVFATLATLNAAFVHYSWWGGWFAVVALVYLGVGVALEPKVQSYAYSTYVVAVSLALLALFGPFPPYVMCYSLPFVMFFCLVIPALPYIGRLNLCNHAIRRTITISACAVGVTLLPYWINGLLQLINWHSGYQGLAFWPLTALYFLGIYYWLERAAKEYDYILQGIGTLITGVVGLYTLK